MIAALYAAALILLLIGSGLVLWEVWCEDDDEQESERWSKWS